MQSVYRRDDEGTIMKPATLYRKALRELKAAKKHHENLGMTASVNRLNDARQNVYLTREAMKNETSS